ncbi:SAV_6107 family HEPN domain-containing protein [Saccharopolyspora cebuensis]|uniref:SAV_6107 family HEPN domain-containing protein n=1 Tax=Saccharopolyspora cebuensis TaxID=418759 RepID=A0ABV4CLI7_9PSEU
MSIPNLSIPAPRRSVEDHRPPQPADVPAGSMSLLVQARSSLHSAEGGASAGERYVAAHLAALRAATAVVVARARQQERTRPTSVWALLTAAAPELREWAAFFAARSDRRAAAEAGVPVTGRDADDLVAKSREFLDVVGRNLTGAAR